MADDRFAKLTPGQVRVLRRAQGETVREQPLLLSALGIIVGLIFLGCVGAAVVAFLYVFVQLFAGGK